VSRRVEKLNKLLAHEVGDIFLTELDLPPDVIVTIMGVDTSPDLHYADILISIIPANRSGSVLSLLRKKIYKIQKTLDRRLAMRPVPKLRFSIPVSENDRLDKLFEEVKKSP
jgi:ribosome-binding factor A